VSIQSPSLHLNRGQATDEERRGKRTKVDLLITIIVALLTPQRPLERGGDASIPDGVCGDDKSAFAYARCAS
jgi:hypothetical protein